MTDITRLIQDLTDTALGRVPRVTVVPRIDRSRVGRHIEVIAENAQIDQLPQPPGRGRSIKRVVLGLGRFTFVRQRAVNTAVIGALGSIIDELDEVRASLSQVQRQNVVAHASLAVQVGATEEAVAQIRDGLPALEGQIRALQDSIASLQSVLEENISFQASERAIDPELLSLYGRFSERFRPTGTELEDRLDAYLADIVAFSDAAHPFVDIGCGTGEFVERLGRAGVSAVGVDIFAPNVEAGIAAGRDIRLADAIDFLDDCQPRSLSGVSAFHLVEHLTPSKLLRLVRAAHRAIKPGGLLVLETPNPTNLNVGAAAFYHDPTHLRPLTPQYLSFLVEDVGFDEVATRFLHPASDRPAELDAEDAASPLHEELWWALQGPQDFAVLGVRNGAG